MVGEEMMRAITGFELTGHLVPFLRIAMPLGRQIGLIIDKFQV